MEESEVEEWDEKTDTKWMSVGACNQDSSIPKGLFFEESKEKEKEAKRICYGCKVREICLRFAELNHINDGVWGGLNAKERRTNARRNRANYGISRK